ncbi:MAG: RagB/SusD family nutrient uptake outer membrane protein [Tannerellaceae bacterium]|jgi:tetratricopeptide (TPR) repeat protein|nr:RagB/SusD family nutrient uptake outer membrane protein [Tannerellaceae bacterium]
MRKHIIIISLFIFASCHDFIELEPDDTVSINQMFTSESDFRDAINGSYHPLRSLYNNFYIFGDLRGDDAWKEVTRGTASYHSDVFTMNDTESLLGNTWEGYYQIISRANFVLEKIEEADKSIFSNLDRYDGEARFLRALAYFDLVRIFGDVPSVKNSLTIDESYTVRREKVETIYNDIIIPDLIDAANKLPVSYSGEDVGRATKGAAKSLLGRVYLTLADFAKAEGILQEVTTMGYALLPDYNDLWTYENEHHSEYIFDIEYMRGGFGQGNSFTYNFLPMHAEFTAMIGISGGWGGEDINPTHVLVQLFETSPGDLRRDITLDATGGFINTNGEFVRFIQAATYSKKYQTSLLNTSDGHANWKVIRYADVLLMLAEAQNENGKTEEALTHLNTVRVRAGVPAYANTGQADIREKIYNERRLELSFEGHRWFDLIRTGRALGAMQSIGMKEHHVFFPIPLTQLQVINNEEILWQNPGY